MSHTPAERKWSDQESRITVVTPSFNQAAFLERTICSVLSQSYPNLEYIVIDGGSTDRSVEILSKYSDRLTYWISESDGGQAEALLKGFARATGAVCCWLNSDDILLPGALHAVNEYFQLHPAEEVVTGGGIQITASDELFRCWCNYTTGVRASYSRLSLLGQQGVFQPSTFWRRNAYLSVGGIDPRLQFIMDLDLFVRLAKRRPFGRLPQPLAGFRVHAASKSSRWQDVQSRELASVRLRYDTVSRIPFGTTLLRGWYHFRLKVEKSLLVLLKPWLLRNTRHLLEHAYGSTSFDGT